MPTVPITHGIGTLNLRSRSGSRRRIASIAAHTATNAVSVPALASAAISLSGKIAAITATTIAVKMVIRTGVPRFDTRARLCGSSPSRAMVKKIRLCPKKNARITVGNAITADRPRIFAASGWSIDRRISASGSGLSANLV